jgi:hypothetical protein
VLLQEEDTEVVVEGQEEMWLRCGRSSLAEKGHADTVESASLKAAATYACAEKTGDEDCVAGA